MIEKLKEMFKPKNKLKVYYHNSDMPALQQKGDWIDLYINDVISIKNSLGIDVTKERKKFIGKNSIIHVEPTDVVRFDLGITVKLPKGYEAHILPRSSTFDGNKLKAGTGLLLSNSMGIIDKLYCGIDDVLQAVCYCTRKATINKFDRLFQLKIEKKQNTKIEYISKEELSFVSRGGFGSTGR